MSTIGFYTDGNPVIGMGHVFRCLALGRALRERREDVRLGFDVHDPEAATILKRAHIGDVEIWPSDSIPVVERDVLVVDRLEAPVEVLQSLRHRCRALVSFDDAGPGHYEADLAINALYYCRVNRPPHSITDSRQGLEYALIGSRFYPRSAPRGSARHLLLSQGGADTFGMLPELVRTTDTALAPWFDAIFHVHVGPGFRFRAELESALVEIGHESHIHEDIGDMPEFMAGMDLAIAGGGVMALELAAMGIPTLLITAETRELETMAALDAAGAACSLGFGNEGLAALPEALRILWKDDRLRADRGSRAARVIDTKGLGRIVDLILARLDIARIRTKSEGESLR